MRPPPDAPNAGFAPVLERNISALIERQRALERASSWDERFAAVISRFAGSMLSVYLHGLVVAAWIIVNLGWTPLPAFDPEFITLAMVASVEAIFLSTFVLITQNRMARESERRAELDLHISLLAEHEVTRLLSLVTAIAAKVGVAESQDPELEPLKHDIAPEQVLDHINAAHGDGAKS